MSALRYTAALLLLLFFVPVQSARGIVMHEAAEHDPAWQQEYKDLGNQYDSVVAMYGHDGTQWWNIGSGVVISPNHVIGAGHSALDDSQQRYQKYHMVTGTHLIDDYWGIYHTTEVAVHPEFTSYAVSPDLAVWTFEDVIADVTPATLYRGNDADKIGSLIDIVGFGMHGYGGFYDGTVLDGAKRGCRNELTQLGWPWFGDKEDQLISHFVMWPNWSSYQHLGGMTASIDSGGGWFVDGDATLIGVNGFGIHNFALDYSGAISVSQHADWIDAQLVSIPEPSSFMMLALAVGVLCFVRRRKR